MDIQNGSKNGSNPEDSNKLNSSKDLLDTNYFYRRGRYDDDDDDDSVDISYKVKSEFYHIYLFIYLFIKATHNLTLVFRTTSFASFIYY